MSADAPAPSVRAVACAIVGGGPAGMMLGLMLARRGVRVVVLEKHADFLRDFRGDTVHPSTLAVLSELGLLDAFRARPHQEARVLTAYFEGEAVPIADFARLRGPCPFLALMPQWDFLDLLAAEAKKLPTFELVMEANATALTTDARGRVTGLRATTPRGPLEVAADLVVGCDGRHSTVRRLAGFAPMDLGAPIDVLWLRLSRRDGDPAQPLGRFSAGHLLVMLDRGDYWQCAFVIPKDGHAALRDRGLDAFRRLLATIAPFVADRVGEVTSWEQVKLLSVRVDRLRRWYRDGLLCLGDAAHAMSPIGGVGINLAIQDAVAAANRLATPLRERRLATSDLAAVQRRRSLPTRVTQRVQVLVQNRVVVPALASAGRRLPMPWPLRLLRRFPRLRWLPARAVGVGVRPEHVASPRS
jgi:2-polyprenyl-6-methoxyphenol hydroxylase-like FAD-dependent oxidoreductase